MAAADGGARLLRLAAATLARLGLDSQVDEIEQLTGGASGAAAFSLALPMGAAVLKVADAEASSEQHRWAARELAFYRQLACRLPLRVPELLGGDDDAEHGCALLIRAYGRPRTLAELSDEEMDTVVSQLVALHASYWGRTDLTQEHPWLAHSAAPLAPADLARAAEIWRLQAAYEPLHGAISADTLTALSAWFAVLQKANHHLADYPLTLIHGDCHLGNVLWGIDGRPVWADWQMVGIGQGPSDMAFLLQRACRHADDACYAHWAQRYAEKLAEAAPEHPDPAWTLQVMDAHELGARLLAWPHYFDRLPREAVAHQIVRLAAAAKRLVQAFG